MKNTVDINDEEVEPGLFLHDVLPHEEDKETE